MGFISAVQEGIDATAQLFRRKDKTNRTVRERERRLQKLEKLRERGDLDEAEYAEQRDRISGA